jgi:hypothetical protein
MRSHWFNLYTLAVYPQIALCATIALATSALALAPHLESPKCAAAPFPPAPFAFDFGFDKGEAHFLRAAGWAVRGWAVRWICRPTYAFRVFFGPFGAV